MELLKRIDIDRNHISRSGWMKQAAEEKLVKPIEQPKIKPDSNIDVDSFLESF